MSRPTSEKSSARHILIPRSMRKRRSVVGLGSCHGQAAITPMAWMVQILHQLAVQFIRSNEGFYTYGMCRILDPFYLMAKEPQKVLMNLLFR